MISRIVWAMICIGSLTWEEISTRALVSGDYGRFAGHTIVIGAVWLLVDRMNAKSKRAKVRS